MNEELRKKLEGLKVLEDFLGLTEAELDALAAQDSVKMLTGQNGFLGRSNNVIFRSFDLPRLITCPEATCKCIEKCYQISVEKRHRAAGRDSAVTLRRKMNLIKSLKNNFVDRMYNEIMRLKPGIDKTLCIRIHSSGDFYNEEYLLKWFEIALKVKQAGKGYIFAAYTKSLHILDNVMNDKPKLDEVYSRVCGRTKNKYEIEDFNIRLIGSIMDDTSKETKQLINKYDLYKHIVTEEKRADLVDCAGEDGPCAACMRCYNHPEKEIYARLR